MLFQQFIKRGLWIKNLSTKSSIRDLAVVPVILQGAFRDAEDAANLLTGQVQFISDGRAVRVDQNIDSPDGFEMSRYSSLNAALSRVMISSGMLQAFYQILFQEMPDVVVPEQYFIP